MNPWTAQDDRALKENAHLGADRCAELLNRTPSAIRDRATQQGISLKKPVEKVPCPHCTKPIAKSGLQQHAIACKSNKEHGLERNQDTGKLQPVGAGTDVKPGETVYVPVIESIVPSPGHSVMETRVTMEEAITGVNQAFAELQEMKFEPLPLLPPLPSISWSLSPNALYCVYCQRYQNGECWISKRDHVTGEWELDIMSPANRKEHGLCEPQRTLLGHIRSIFGLEVG